MNGYDQQLKELLAQCARKRKLEASAAELRRQRDTYAARAEELKEAMREEQADVDRLEGRSLAAFFYNVEDGRKADTGAAGGLRRPGAV